MEIGDQIGKARRGLAKSRVHGVNIPAMGRQADRHRHDMRALQRLYRVVIGRVVDHDAIARPGKPVEQQRKALLRAIGDDDLIRVRRATAPIEMGRDRAPQYGQAKRIIAQISQIGGQRLDSRLHRATDARRSGQRGMGPVEQIAAGDHVDVRLGRFDPARRQAGDAARPLPTFQIALVPQSVERRRDRRARQAKRGGQFPLARQADVQPHPPVEHQHPQRLRQLAIGGLGAVLRAPCAQQAEQGRRTKEGSGHDDLIQLADGQGHLCRNGPFGKGQL